MDAADFDMDKTDLYGSLPPFPSMLPRPAIFTSCDSGMVMKAVTWVSFGGFASGGSAKRSRLPRFPLMSHRSFVGWRKVKVNSHNSRGQFAGSGFRIPELLMILPNELKTTQRYMLPMSHRVVAGVV